MALSALLTNSSQSNSDELDMDIDSHDQQPTSRSSNGRIDRVPEIDLTVNLSDTSSEEEQMQTTTNMTTGLEYWRSVPNCRDEEASTPHPAERWKVMQPSSGGAHQFRLNGSVSQTKEKKTKNALRKTNSVQNTDPLYHCEVSGCGSSFKDKLETVKDTSLENTPVRTVSVVTIITYLTYAVSLWLQFRHLCSS